MPKVTIITATHNGSQFIRETIDSVLSQTYSDFEYIIVNDASTDTTKDILEEYAKKDARITVCHNEKNLERSASRNIWIKKAQWEYIAFIDDDDIWEKNKLELQTKFLEDHTDYIFCGTQTIFIDTHSIKIWESHLIEKNEDIKNKFLIYNPFVFSSIVIRRSSNLQPFDERTSMAEDYKFLLGNGTYGKVINLKEPLTRYRLASNSSLKHQLRLRYNCIKNCIQYRKEYPNFYQAIFLWISLFFLPYSMVKFLNSIFPEKIRKLFF